MRLTLTLFILGLTAPIWAQINNLQPAGTIVSLAPRHHATVGANRDILFQENFAGGIPADWDNEESGGVAEWQYRGMNSTPNLEVGTQGSCLPDGVIGEPIQSPTAGNGFVIFDSNWWDNPDLPCTEANFGSGPGPGPHYATLTSPTIDLTNQYGVALQFYQYYKSFDAHASVELSSDGGFSWFEIYNNDLATNPTDVNDMVQIPIGQMVGGLSEVKFRFVFNGLYYFWQLDDVAIITIPLYDMSIGQPHYGDFDLEDPAHPTGFEFMEYSRYPIQMAPLLKFSATAYNDGIYENPDVRLNVEITDASDVVIHSAQSDEGFYVFPGTPQEVRAGSFQMPATLGEYHVHQFITGINEESDPYNQHDSTFFQIHEVQYARDRQFASSVYFPSEEFNEVPYEIGNVFLNTADDMTLYSLSVGLGVGTTTPTTVYGALYEIDLTTDLITTLIATTPAINVTNDMLNGYADQILTTLTFDSPIALENGKAYLAMAGSDDGGNHMVCALAGDAPEYTSWVHFLPNEWRLVSMIPMVRMNFGEFDNVAEIPSNAALQIFPNPAKGAATIMTEQSFGYFTAILFDQTGREIRKYTLTGRNHVIDLSGIPTGLYAVQTPYGSAKLVVE
jgi:Secretion system C-terminal sorting domain